MPFAASIVWDLPIPHFPVSFAIHFAKRKKER
jgi:hypothetical protein